MHRRSRCCVDPRPHEAAHSSTRRAMLTDGIAQRHHVALRSTNTLAGTVDLSRVGELSTAHGASAPRQATDAAGVTTLAGGGFALATVGRLASARNEGALLCVGVGAPRFDSRMA